MIGKRRHDDPMRSSRLQYFVNASWRVSAIGLRSRLIELRLCTELLLNHAAYSSCPQRQIAAYSPSGRLPTERCRIVDFTPFRMRGGLAASAIAIFCKSRNGK